MVSPAVGYAAAAMGYLACVAKGPMRVADLAKAIGAPSAYLAKIIHALARRRLLATVRGKGGGVTLAVDPRRLSLHDICVALDDDILHPACALATSPCSDARACPAHELQKTIRKQQLAFLESTSVLEVGEFNARRASARRPGAAKAPRPRKGRS